MSGRGSFYVLLLLAGLKTIDHEQWKRPRSMARMSSSASGTSPRPACAADRRSVVVLHPTFNQFGLVFLMTAGGRRCDRFHSILAYEKAIEPCNMVRAVRRLQCRATDGGIDLVLAKFMRPEDPRTGRARRQVSEIVFKPSRTPSAGCWI
jgi:hypothetical protein